MALTKVHNRMQAGEVFSVFDYGAVGDGVTDDTAAIQAALDAAGAFWNSGVFLPSGYDYLVTSTLELPTGVRLFSDGSERGSIKGIKSNVVSAPTINVKNGYFQSIENINIRHINTASSGTAVQLIDNDGVGSGSDPAQFFRMRNVNLVEHVTGLRISSESTWCVFEDVLVERCTSVSFSISNANLTVFSRCISDGSATAWFLENTTKTILDKCTAQTCTSTTIAAVQVVGCSNVEINHLWTERNGFHNVHVRSASRLTRIQEMLNQGAGWDFATSSPTGTGRGIFIEGSSDTIIDGGWHGGNATEDITIGAGATETTLIDPRSTTTLSFTDASGTAFFVSKSISGLSGLSGTSVKSNNLRGSVTISDANTTAAVSFAIAEANTAFFVIASATVSAGTPAAGSTRCYVTNQATSGFTINLEVAPGAGNSVRVSWFIIR